MKPQDKTFFKDNDEKKRFDEWYKETMKRAYDKQYNETDNPDVKRIILKLKSELEIC
jgi:hypothetical protein